jgi:mannose-6-phosphate isomerase-like protein (cupin superfamily)
LDLARPEVRQPASMSRSACSMSGRSDVHWVLQRHEDKTETISVLSGRGRFELGEDREDFSIVELADGGTVHVAAGVIHRITALTTLVFAEVSTALPGWNTDIERLEDSFGRSGTVAP